MLPVIDRKAVPVLVPTIEGTVDLLGRYDTETLKIGGKREKIWSRLERRGNSRELDEMKKSKTKPDRHPEDVYPWDRARGQTNKCCYCKADCTWVVCKECSDLIAQGKPPKTPTYRPPKKGLLRRHTFGGEVR